MTNTTPETQVSTDPVNHPSHYTQYPVEVIELTRHMSFDRGNAVKYIARAGYKGGPEKELEDINKAIWYLNDDRKQIELKLAKAKADEAAAEEGFTRGIWKDKNGPSNTTHITINATHLNDDQLKTIAQLAADQNGAVS